MDAIKKLWADIVGFFKKWWLLLVAGGILLFLAFRGCNNLPTHQDDKKSVDSLIVAYTARKQSDQRIIDSLKRDDLKLTQERDSLISEIFDAQTDLENRGKIIKATITTGQLARSKLDTAAIIRNADSLVAQVEAGIPAVVGYTKLSDSLIATCVAQGQVKDSIAQHWKDLFLHADTAVALQQSKYNSLYLDYTKANARLKFNKATSRVEAVVLLAALLKIFVIK